MTNGGAHLLDEKARLDLRHLERRSDDRFFHACRAVAYGEAAARALDVEDPPTNRQQGTELPALDASRLHLVGAHLAHAGAVHRLLDDAGEIVLGAIDVDERHARP